MNNSKIIVETNHPIAVDSLDHLYPFGTAVDNATNPKFNKKLYELFKKLNRPLRILDLGCAGGGFVKDCLNDNHFAIGIEGSDYSKIRKRAEWAHLTDINLFTADITKEFKIKQINNDKENLILFDVITLWEVFEHLAKKDLEMVCKNIKNHLKPAGLVLASISPYECDTIPFHQTVEEEDWWINFFKTQKLYYIKDYEDHFEYEYIRSVLQGDLLSFNLILSQKNSINKNHFLSTI